MGAMSLEGLHRLASMRCEGKRRHVLGRERKGGFRDTMGRYLPYGASLAFRWTVGGKDSTATSFASVYGVCFFFFRHGSEI